MAATTNKTTKAQILSQKLNNGNKKYSVIKFPDDLDTDATQNIFLININAVSGSNYQGRQYKKIEGETSVVASADSNSLHRKFAGNTVRIDKTIALYMPPNVQSNYQSNWNNAELGAAGAVVDAFTGIGDLSNFQTYKDIWNTGKAIAPEYLGMTAAAVASALSPFNVKDAATFVRQSILNPYMEVIFNGVSNRTFSFSFKFIPRSKDEQYLIKNIVDTLKFHRAPEKKIKGVNSIWAFPSTFDLSFLNKQGQQNAFLFKISTCALTDMQVTYGDGSYSSFDDGSPYSTSLTLQFTELEVLDKERILEGF